MARPVQTKDFRLEIKAVGEDGTFEGYLSVYDVVDLGNDLVEKGAFTKTIQEQKGVVPMLWAHDQKQPLGALTLSDDDTGLKVIGEFFLAASEKAREMYAMAKAFQEKGRPMGLSIGYEAVKKEIKNGVRRLKELKLHEGSLTLFPMLPIAQVAGIKADDFDGRKDFLAELNRIHVYRFRDMIMSALFNSLDEILYAYTAEADAAERITLSEATIEQFRSVYLEHLPKLLDMWGIKSLPLEAKAGRRISAATRTQVEEAITKLQALLTTDDATSEEEAESGKSVTTEPPQAQADSDKPKINLHLIADSFKFQSIGDIK
jgi:HK97 family phage prohead protease